MRAILFDLGDTLVDAQNHPLPGAIALLTAVRDLRDPEGKPVLSGLISDWDMSQNPARETCCARNTWQSTWIGPGCISNL